MSDPRDWDLEYDGAAPPLPREMERQRSHPDDREWADRVERLLPQGCYLVWFEPRIPEEVEPHLSEPEGLPLPGLLCGVLRVRHRPKPPEAYRPWSWLPGMARGFLAQRRRRTDKDREANRPLLSSGSGDLYAWNREELQDLIRRLPAPEPGAATVAAERRPPAEPARRMLRAIGKLLAPPGPREPRAKRARGDGKNPDGRRLRALSFPKSRYRYYFRVETLWVTEREAALVTDDASAPPTQQPRPGKGEAAKTYGLVLGLDMRSYDAAAGEWRQRQPLTVRLDSVPPPDAGEAAELDGYAPAAVHNSLGTEIGVIRLARVSSLVRHAVVQIHHLRGLEMPDDEGVWRETFSPAGWSVELPARRAIPDELAPKAWSIPALQRFHEDHIDAAEGSPAGSPEEWVYHLLVVDRMLSKTQRETAGKRGNLGFMYDLERDGLPRQGAAVAALEPVPKSDPAPDAPETAASVPGPGGSAFPGEKPLQEAFAAKDQGTGRADPPPGTRRDLFHWVALHEFAHMLGLYHNPSQRSLMQPRRYRDHAFDPDQDLALADVDQRRLWHLPDLWVRPGGVPYGHRYRKTPVDFLDLIPTGEIQLEIVPQTLLCGEPLRSLDFVVRAPPGSLLVVIPGPRASSPGNKRLAITLRGPDGVARALFSEEFPRVLGETEEQSVIGAKAFTVELPEGPTGLTQVGVYRLEADLCWIGLRDNRFHHIRGETRIRVV